MFKRQCQATHSLACLPAVSSHSHTMNTRQPWHSKRRQTLSFPITFRSNFCSQNEMLLFDVEATRAAFMTAPEAPMHENDNAVLAQNKVGFPWQTGSI